MQVNGVILAVVTACLPEIQRTLGQKRWPAFADRLQAHAASFQNLASEADLTRAVDQLMSFFLEDEQVADLITEIELEDRELRQLFRERQHPSNSKPQPVTIKLDTITSYFFLICMHADLIAAGTRLAEISARSGAQQYKRPGTAS